MQRAGLDGQRGHGHRVLEQPTQVGVVTVARRGPAAQRRAQPVVAQDTRQQGAQRRVAHLAGQMLEEAVELVEVAVGDGQEGGRIGVPRVGASDRADVDLQLLAEALDPPGDADQVAAVEAPGVQVGITEDPSRERSGAIAQLDREVRRAGARDEPILARAGEDPGQLVAVAQGADGRGGHEPMMYRDPDAAADLGAPPRRPARPGTGLRLHGVERRRRCRLGRAPVPRRVARRHPLRPDRPRRLLRLPGHATEGDAHRRARPQDRVARGRDLRRPRASRAARPRPAAGRRAVDALARILPARRRPRRGAGHPARGHHGRIAGRRAALAAGAHHRPVLRRGARPAPRPAARRATRARRASSACCTPPARRRACRRPACGPACRTTSRPRPTPRPRSRSCASSSRSSACRSTPRSSSGRPPTTSARSRWPCRATPTCRPSSSASSAPRPRRRTRSQPSDLPSGDVLAREFQRFLRQRGPGQD